LSAAVRIARSSEDAGKISKTGAAHFPSPE
jgi:hypothetical protein